MFPVITSATWRVLGRAVVVGLTALFVQLQGSQAWDTSILKGAIVAAVLAALEVLTPLNSMVGVNKTPPPTTTVVGSDSIIPS